jgi:WD40 repeat protein
MHDHNLQTLKCYFVDPSGVSKIVQLSSQDSYAVSSPNHNVYHFDFFSGTVKAYFYAHEDTITSLLFKENMLITCSLDQTIKFWDLNAGQLREPASI